MRTIHYIALILVIIGALNWGLVGFFNIDVISGIFGGPFQIHRIIFALIGLAGLWSFSFFKKLSYVPPDTIPPK
jgi:uncharacterized protein